MSTRPHRWVPWPLRLDPLFVLHEPEGFGASSLRELRRPRVISLFAFALPINQLSTQLN